MRTYSTTKLALIAAVPIVVLSAVAGILPYYIRVPLWIYIGMAFLSAAVTYILLLLFLRTYLNAKIEPIYKIINTNKDTSTDNVRSIAEVDADVQKWMRDKDAEIARLKEMERYRKEFVGDVSHELKTPIFNVQGYIETLQDGAIDDLKVRDLYLKRAANGIERMINIVTDLDAITRLESGEVKLLKESFDIVKLVRDVLDQSEQQAANAGITLKMSRQPRRMLAYADRKRITEVLENLVSNAIKYGKKNRDGYVQVAFHDMNDVVAVEIKDNGTGISESDLPRVFERFFRAERSRSREQGGTGLGLSIVKHIIEAHRQQINVKSEINSGTIFTFTLEKSK
ncbi:MAG: GHKL domain-containing protein [Bacteroidales bacterium]|jgi:two-component system phosphate regulon sensor histidine kinase PhoR|nr:GHKL domain-containing protein [Bacteroidales bacterium]